MSKDSTSSMPLPALGNICLLGWVWMIVCCFNLNFPNDLWWEWKWKLLSCVQFFVTQWTIQSMEFSRPEYWSGKPFPSTGDLPNPGIKPRSPALQADSLPAEPPGKPKDTGVGSLSLLQGTFPTQELNWRLLHCRQILYQLSYKGSPRTMTKYTSLS